MKQNTYPDPAHNPGCNYHFTCGAAQCPETRAISEIPLCHIDKFRRYQPDNIWYRKDWEEK